MTKETITAGGIVIQKKTRRVVVVNQNHNSWSLPKGHVDPEENFIEAAVREIYEECGIEKPELLEQAGNYTRYKIGLHSADDTSELKKMIFFTFETNETGLHPHDKNNPEARWVHNSEVQHLLTHEKDINFFENYRLKNAKLFTA